MGRHPVLRFCYELLPHKLTQWSEDFAYRRFIRELDDYSPYIPEHQGESPLSKTIWVFWWQGFDQAPPLVKMCAESIKAHADGYEVRLLDRDTVSDYVTIDPYIYQMAEAGKLKLAHFSDLLRLYLLANYGGVWADATVFMTGSIPEDILASDIFLFRGDSSDALNLKARSSVSNWFIAAKPNNPVINTTLGIMLGYLQRHRKFYTYYMMHWVITEAFRRNRELWNEMPLYEIGMPHMLQNYLGNFPFTEKDYARVASLCFLHKLSYKREAKEGSILEHILS